MKDLLGVVVGGLVIWLYGAVTGRNAHDAAASLVVGLVMSGALGALAWLVCHPETWAHFERPKGGRGVSAGIAVALLTWGVNFWGEIATRNLVREYYTVSPSQVSGVVERRDALLAKCGLTYLLIDWDKNDGVRQVVGYSVWVGRSLATKWRISPH